MDIIGQPVTQPYKYCGNSALLYMIDFFNLFNVACSVDENLFVYALKNLRHLLHLK